MDPLEQQAQEAIKAGANPEQVYARLEAMRQQMQPQQPQQPQQNQHPAMRGMPGMPAVADEEFANHLKATVKNLGRNIVNIPHNVNEDIPAFVDTNRNYFEEYGIKQSIPDEILQTAIEYSPFGRAAKLAIGGLSAATKIPKLAKGFTNLLATSALGNAAYGAAANKDDRVKGGTIGGTIGAAAPLIGKGAEALIIKPAAKFIAQQSGTPLAKKAVNFLSKSKDPQEAAQEFNVVYKARKDENKALWENTDTIAKKIDESYSQLPKVFKVKGKLMNNKFEPAPYNKFLNNYIREKSALEPAKQAAFSDSIELAQQLQGIAPKSFSGMVSLRQGMNDVLQKFLGKKNLTGADRETKKLIEEAKNKLIESIPTKVAPALKNEVASFKTNWEQANKSHQKLNEFYDVPSKLGVKKTQQEMKSLLREGGQAADGAIFDLFTPAGTQTGKGGFDHLAKLVGDKNAQDYLKGYLFRNMGKGDSMKALTVYHKLSPVQRKAIFGDSKEGKLLESASRTWTEIGKNEDRFFSHLPWLHGLGGAGIPALATTAGAYFVGDQPLDKSIMMGLGVGGTLAGAGKGIANLSPNFLSIPNTARRLATEGLKKPGSVTSNVLQAAFNKERQ